MWTVSRAHAELWGRAVRCRVGRSVCTHGQPEHELKHRFGHCESVLKRVVERNAAQLKTDLKKLFFIRV
jgi:hypothetical protein